MPALRRVLLLDGWQHPGQTRWRVMHSGSILGDWPQGLLWLQRFTGAEP